MHLDEAIKISGGLGRYQILLVSLLMIPASFPSAFVPFSQVFILASPDHHCAAPPYVQANPEMLANWTVPQEWRDGRWRDSRCYVFANYSALLDEWTLRGWERPPANTSWPLERCPNGWTYDRSDYDETLVTKFDLVCENRLWPFLAISAFYAGSIFGTQSMGWISDRYGRRPALLALLFLTVILPSCSAFSPNFPVYVLFRFLIGFTFPAVFHAPFIIVMEITSEAHRTGMGMMANLLFGVGMSVLAGVAALTRHWFTLLMWTTVPFASLLVYWWIIPESPRWLVAQNRLQEAEDILQKMAKLNRKQVPPNLVNSCKSEEKEKEVEKKTEEEKKPEADQSSGQDVLALFRTPNLRKKTILTTIIFLSNSLVYTGLCYMSANLGVSDYLAFGIGGLVEAPSCLLAWVAMERWGRRWTTAATMMIVGLCCAANVFVPEEMTWMNVLLPSVGKFGITGAFSVVYLFGAELLPTVVRGKGLAFCCLLCSMGLIASPYVIYLVVYSRVLPLLVMGILSFLGGMAAVFLPETVGMVLPETLEDGERFGKDLKVLPDCCFWWRKRRNNSTKEEGKPTERTENGDVKWRSSKHKASEPKLTAFTVQDGGQC